MEKAEINLEKVQILIDKLKSQVSDHSLIDHLLPTAQMLVAELQRVSVRQFSTKASVSIVMPSASAIYQPVQQAQEAPKEDKRPIAVAHAAFPVEAPQRFVLQPPVTVTEQAPEQVLDSNSYNPGEERLNEITQPSIVQAPEPEPASYPVEANTAPMQPVQSQQKQEAQIEIEKETPEEKQVYELTDDGQEDLSAMNDFQPTFPTSIPADSPQIQPDASAAYGHEQRPSILSQQPGTTESALEKESETQTVHQNITPDYPEPQDGEKKRQLEFIHENFSAWSDYGIINEAPTLVQNHPLVHDGTTQQQKDLNEHYREDREEWSQTLQSTPIENLNNAIGINDRYLFISELFRGDESMYERSIVTLNKFHDFNQAHAWSERELRLKLGWDIDNPITQQFEQLVKRRFMNKG